MYYLFTHKIFNKLKFSIFSKIGRGNIDKPIENDINIIIKKNKFGIFIKITFFKAVNRSFFI